MCRMVQTMHLCVTVSFCDVLPPQSGCSLCAVLQRAVQSVCCATESRAALYHPKRTLALHSHGYVHVHNVCKLRMALLFVCCICYCVLLYHKLPAHSCCQQVTTLQFCEWSTLLPDTYQCRAAHKKLILGHLSCASMTSTKVTASQLLQYRSLQLSHTLLKFQ